MMKRIRVSFFICLSVAVLLFGAMCANVGYSYARAVCAMEHHYASAPPSIAFLIAIPYLFAISILAVVGFVLYKKQKGASL